MTKNVMDKEKIKIMRIACLDITIGITPGAVAHPGLLLGWGLKLWKIPQRLLNKNIK